ncbi:hypothetical protein GCM10009551_094010 [Nocardiopsis tropica]|uniref:aldo/keto reductase n=1 Tax=Tsukamurella strandjordii TaxID=147577 RepID=UPI0031E43CF0
MITRAIHPVAAIQSELSLWTRDALGQDSDTVQSAPGNVVTWCRDHDAIFVPFSPLGRGFLTGELKVDQLDESDLRTSLPRFTGAAATQNLALLDTIQRVAQRHNTTAAAIALAWVLDQGPHVIPIPGTTKSARLDENLSAAAIPLTRQDLTELNALPAAIGGRY